MMGKKAASYRPMSPVRHRGTCPCGFVVTAKTPRALRLAQADHDAYMLGKNVALEPGMVLGVDVGHGPSIGMALCCDEEFPTMDELIKHLEVKHGF